MFEYHHDGAEPTHGTVDIAILDMNHGFENLGTPSLVRVLRAATEAVTAEMGGTRSLVRAIRYDIRQKGDIPDPARFRLMVGTGGPGHPDPRGNDGVSEGSLGITEDPSWELPLFRMLEETARREDGYLLGICHTYGLLCRWSGLADARLRGEAKGGRSQGIVENEFAEEALASPYFGAFATLPGGRLRAFDNRQFDLLPRDVRPSGAIPIGYEVTAGERGDALTMAQFAADGDGFPRVFGVNFHPEIIDCRTQVGMLAEMRDAGEISQETFETKSAILAPYAADDAAQVALRATADLSLVAPLKRRLGELLR